MGLFKNLRKKDLILENKKSFTLYNSKANQNIILNRSIMAMEFGAQCIKIIQAKVTKNKIKLEKIAKIEDLENIYSNGIILNKEELKHRIKATLNNNDMKGSKMELICTLENSVILKKELIIPELEADEDIVGLGKTELAAMMLINLDDYVFQHRTLEKFEEDGKKQMRILLVAIPEEMCKAHFDLLRDIDLKPSALELSFNSIEKLLAFDNKYKGVEVAVLDVGYENSSISIFQDCKYKFGYIVEIGNVNIERAIADFYGIDLKDAIKHKGDVFEYTIKYKTLSSLPELSIDDEAYADRDITHAIRDAVKEIGVELKRITDFYNERISENKITEILICGDIFKLPGVTEYLGLLLETNIRPIVLESIVSGETNENLLEYINTIGIILRRN